MCLRSHSCFLLCFCLSMFANLAEANKNIRSQDAYDFHVGVVLDMNTSIGKAGWNCIEIALADFYDTHQDYRSRLFLHLRDSNGDNVQASLAGETIVNNMTRFVVSVWLFIILILTSSYTASLSSILTVQRLQPTVTGIEELIKSGECVGYLEGSFIVDLLKDLNFDESKLKSFISKDDIDEALRNGSRKGGIAAFFAAVPYTKLLISKYCNRYTMVGLISKTQGFGIAFQKGSPLVADVSSALMKVLESSKMKELEKSVFGDNTICSETVNSVISNSLNLKSFRGLFIITGSVSGFALLVFLFVFLYKNKQVLTTANANTAIWMKLKTILKKFDEKDLSSYSFKRKRLLEHRDVTVSPSTTDVSEVRDMEASPAPSFTNVLAYTDGGHFPSQGITLTHVNDIRLEELEDIELSE